MKKYFEKSHFFPQNLIFHCLKKNLSTNSIFFFTFVHTNVQNFWHIKKPQKKGLKELKGLRCDRLLVHCDKKCWDTDFYYNTPGWSYQTLQPRILKIHHLPLHFKVVCYSSCTVLRLCSWTLSIHPSEFERCVTRHAYTSMRAPRCVSRTANVPEESQQQQPSVNVCVWVNEESTESSWW